MKSLEHRISLEQAACELHHSDEINIEDELRQRLCEVLAVLHQHILRSKSGRLNAKSIAAGYLSVIHSYRPDLLGRSLRQAQRETGIGANHICNLSKQFEEKLGLRSSRRKHED